MGKKKSNKAKNKSALSPKAVNTPVQKEEVKAEVARTDMVADFINLNSRLFKYFDSIGVVKIYLFESVLSLSASAPSSYARAHISA